MGFSADAPGVSLLSDSPLTPPGISDSATVVSAESPPAPRPSEGEAADQPWQSLSPQWVTVERIASWAFALVLSVVGAVVVGSIVVENWPPEWPGRILIGAYAIAAVGLMVLSHALPAIAYRHTRYRLSDVGFEIRRGILWRSSIIVPHNRVQHTDVAQGPLQRPFDLGKLIIYTAGTQNASVELNGLAFETACQLRDALVGRPEGADGV